MKLGPQVCAVCDNCFKNTFVHFNAHSYNCEGKTYLKIPCPHCGWNALLKPEAPTEEEPK